MAGMLDIVKYPDPRLKEHSKEVDSFDTDLHRLLDEMAKTMYGANGVGLAAPQVDKTIRAFIVDIGELEKTPPKLYEFINPRLSEGEGKIEFQEGCLSIPGFSESVERNRKIKVQFQDRFGKSHELHAENLLAVAIQHENDHLDGILFIERLSPLKRKLMRKQIEKTVVM